MAGPVASLALSEQARPRLAVAVRDQVHTWQLIRAWHHTRTFSSILTFANYLRKRLLEERRSVFYRQCGRLCRFHGLPEEWRPRCCISSRRNLVCPPPTIMVSKSDIDVEASGPQAPAQGSPFRVWKSTPCGCCRSRLLANLLTHFVEATSRLLSMAWLLCPSKHGGQIKALPISLGLHRNLPMASHVFETGRGDKKAHP